MLEIVADFFGNTIYILAMIEVVFMIFLLFAERGDPTKLAVWILIFILIPIFGFLVYLLVGQTFYADHTFRLKGVKDEEIKNLFNIEDGRLKTDETDYDADVSKMAQTMKNLGGVGYTTNNDVKLFVEGQDKFDSLFEDLRNAKTYIFMEYYIIRNDELGNELMQILTDKVKEGVEVKLLTDAFGIGKGPKKAIGEFKKAGGEYATFHNVLMLALSPKKNNRNHRKIAIIDGLVSYCGGFNVGDEYLGKGPLGHWRDSAVRIVGAATFTLTIRFVLDWTYATGLKYARKDEKYFPAKLDDDFGETRVQVVSGGPDVARINPVRMQYLELIKSAKDTVYIHSPYFIPDESLTDALRMAAASGVDVKIIIPDKPDHMFVFWNNIASANEVMKGGVRVFMYEYGFVHSKTVVVDGKYCSVGSANMDDRSLVLNFETNTMIYSTEIGEQMNKAFEEDLKHCKEYSCEEYAKRTTVQKLRIGISKLFKNLS